MLMFLFSASQHIHVVVNRNFRRVKSSQVTCLGFIRWWRNCLENLRSACIVQTYDCQNV